MIEVAVGTDRHRAVVLTIGLACTFDSSGSPPGANSIGGENTGSTTGSTGAHPTTLADDTTSLTDPKGSGDSGDVVTTNAMETASTTEPGTDESGAPTEGLIDEGLLARWFLDEAAFGTVPTQTADAADEPFDLPIDFASGDLAWTEENGHRGLRWMVAGGDGAPLRAIAGSKFDMLQGRRRATIEIVASVEQVISQDSRLFHIGTGADAGDFTLRSDDLNELEFVLEGQSVAAWAVDLPMLGRAVFHVVFDTTQVMPENRVRLYVNGGLEEPVSSSPPELNAGVQLSQSPYLSLGNRDGDRSIEGAVYYAAFYASALGVKQIEYNATLLFEDDDAP
jgi:hypothetical protein